VLCDFWFALVPGVDSVVARRVKVEQAVDMYLTALSITTDPDKLRIAQL
jgi:hypothetical protein